MKIPKTHRPWVPKAIRIFLGHVDTILMLAHKHHSLNGHLLSARSQGPFRQLLEGSSHLSVEFRGVATLQSQYLSIGSNTEHTFLDDSAEVHSGHLDVVTVVVGIDGTQIFSGHLVASVFLEALEVGLVVDLANYVEVLLGPLAGVGCYLDRH